MCCLRLAGSLIQLCRLCRRVQPSHTISLEGAVCARTSFATDWALFVRAPPTSAGEGQADTDRLRRANLARRTMY